MASAIVELRHRRRAEDPRTTLVADDGIPSRRLRKRRDEKRTAITKCPPRVPLERSTMGRLYEVRDDGTDSFASYRYHSLIFRVVA